MYMTLRRNKHKRISFNTTIMTSLGFIAPPKILGCPLNLAPPPKKKKLFFLLRSPPQLFCPEIFRSPHQRDLPLNNAAIMVKWKCLILSYSSKGICRIDSQLKKLTLNTLSPMYSGTDNNNLSFFVLIFTTLKNKISIFKYF